METLDKIFNEWCAKNCELYQASEKLIREVLDKFANQRMYIDYDEFPCSVTYDGGNHPEYASNAFSNVSSVYLKDDKVYLETEDADEYSIENISASELYNVAFSAYHTLNDKCDAEE